jgi:acetyl esterase/lipase
VLKFRNPEVALFEPQLMSRGRVADLCSAVCPQLAGGGYILGACNQQLTTVAATAAGANLTIICPDYRLAPEHPFPAGLNDALSVYKVSRPVALWISTIILPAESSLTW